LTRSYAKPVQALFRTAKRSTNSDLDFYIKKYKSGEAAHSGVKGDVISLAGGE
jgi:hypothetical protein